MNIKIQKLVDVAIEEWQFFGQQEIDIKGKMIKRGRKENDNGYWQRIGEYWEFGTEKNYTGKDRDMAWSAAFMSYIIKQSGYGNKFLYSISHCDFINKAISAKKKLDNGFSFWGQKLTDYKPKIGDLVCYSRQNGVSYENRPTNYISHSDVVISIDNNELIVIGGNVEDSVTKKHLKLDANGFFIDTSKDWFVILENKLTDANQPYVLNNSYSNIWLKKALEITGDFETSGNPYSGISGNFDGMGISCGVLQWNIGKGSLQPLIIKAGKDVVIKYMPVYGEELWVAVNENVENGLEIVRTWQKGNVIKNVVKNELSNLFASNEMIQIQLFFANERGKKAFEFATKWANEVLNQPASLKEFCWFFDLLVLNGSLKGLWLADVKKLLEKYDLQNVKDIIFEWIRAYPQNVLADGNNISTYGRNDCLKNIEIWNTRISSSNIYLFVLGYLRAKLSRPEFQLIVMNRRGTIAIGNGIVNAELEEIIF